MKKSKLALKIFFYNYKNITDKKLPYLVALDDENVVGIAYLNKFRDKSGYRFVYENTIYVNNEYVKKGIGSKLLKKLITEFKKK